MKKEKSPRVGTAAWSIPKESAERFPTEGSHLQRYSRELSGVEINSSFYREHQPKTYARWAAETPDEFEFSVKLSRAFTHPLKRGEGLVLDEGRLAEVLSGYRELGEKLGVLLIQFPPSYAFDSQYLTGLFRGIREVLDVPVVVEPRHPSWLTGEARSFLIHWNVSKVVADPDPIPSEDEDLLSCSGIVYCRLHGSPEMYRSNYAPSVLDEISKLIRAGTAEKKVWVIFDNTTFGHATENALDLGDKFTGKLTSEEVRTESPERTLRDKSDHTFRPADQKGT